MAPILAPQTSFPVKRKSKGQISSLLLSNKSHLVEVNMNMTIKILQSTLVALFISWTLNAFAQEAAQQNNAETAPATEQGDIDFVEKLLERKATEFKDAPVRSLNPEKKKQKVEYSAVQSESFYSDLATIQKNYMPKSGRLFLSGGISLLPSDVFYRTMGLNLKTSYHFTETWGLEAFGYILTSQEREEVGELEDEQGLSVRSLVSLNAFYGLNIYFNSMYGKTSLLNSRIIPFEIYQTIGIGRVRTQGSEEATSIQVGLGDMFSLSRSNALRVDLTWAFYNTNNYLGEQQSANSLFLTLSYGQFIPEPEYR